jgi:DNA-binding MarR family transcriptional regulator
MVAPEGSLLVAADAAGASTGFAGPQAWPAIPFSMTERSVTSPRVRASPARSRAGAVRETDTDAIVARYADRGRECAFANTRLLGRVVTNFYDAALEPADLRASQLALLRAIVACEPVEMGRLGEVTETGQTTLSRTVEKLRRAALVGAEAGRDRRVRLLGLTGEGRRRFARAGLAGKRRNGRPTSGFRSQACASWPSGLTAWPAKSPQYP